MTHQCEGSCEHATSPQRRAVLGMGVAGAAGLALAACGSSGSGSTSSASAATSSAGASSAGGEASGPASSAASGGAGAGSAAEVPVGGATIVSVGSTAYVVAQPTKGNFVAHSAVCPHQGCLCNAVEGKTAVCPCHGSKFNVETGAVEQGPATEGLAPATVTDNGGTLNFS